MGATRLASGKDSGTYLAELVFSPFSIPDERGTRRPHSCLRLVLEFFLQRVSDYLKCNKIGRAFNADFERHYLTGRDGSNTYLLTRSTDIIYGRAPT